MTPGEDSKAMRQWKKQKEYEERYNKRFRALDVGVVRGKKASEEWLPNFGGVWNSGPRSENRSSFHNERMEGKKIGKGSVISSLNSFISKGGEGYSKEETERILEESKKAVFNKIQVRMHNK